MSWRALDRRAEATAVDTMPTGNGAPVPPPSGRNSALGFYFAVLAIYLVAGSTAQAVSPVIGLAWSEIFAFLLPATAAAEGSGFRVGSYLLLSRPSLLQLSLGFFAGAAGFVFAGAVMALSARVFPHRWVEAFDVTRIFTGPPLRRAALAIIASVLAPICEEAAFRGYVQTTLRRRFPPAAAISASAVLFAAMHLDPVRFLALVLLGATFGWLAYRAGSLWPAVAAHAANNGIGSVLAAMGYVGQSEEVPPLQSELATLALGAALLVPVLAAYRRATEPPPPISEALVRRDPLDASVRFRLARVSPALRSAARIGFVLFAAIVAVRIWSRIPRR